MVPSREHAPGVIKAKGVPVIIAHSFARIFFRNAINIGLPVVEIGEQVDRIDAGDAIGVDLSKGIVYNLTKNEQYQGLSCHNSFKILRQLVVL